MMVARDSKQIALATSHDSIAMKTVVVLTMCFLPATFVAVKNHLHYYDVLS
jgi:hypothetical protein